MKRMFHAPELEHSRQRDRFDPILEGERHGLIPGRSPRLWKRVSEDATDVFGRRNEDQARKQFQELATRIAARGGRLQPDPGRRTRVAIEIDSDSSAPWPVDELMSRVPGRK